jgi:hypothetical protein
MSDGSPDDDRQQRLRELEARMGQRPGVGIRPWLALGVMVGCAVMLQAMQLDVLYFFSSREPIDLGREGEYRLERAVSNRYVELHGLPAEKAWFLQEQGESWVAVPVRDAPVLVRRRTLSTEPWKPGERPPKPDQRAFGLSGRLLSREDAQRYAEVFRQHQEWDGGGARWILLAEERPGASLSTAAWAGLLGALLALNGWLLVRSLLGRR